MNLHFKKYGNHPENLVILHGLFGMLDNWHTLATRFSVDFTVWIIDARNHGKSPWKDTISYPEMAEDLSAFFASNNIDSAYIIGHSMGGKTAMVFANNYPLKTKKLVVVDIASKAYVPRHNEISSTLLNLNLKSIHNRKEAEEALSKEIPERDTVLFLLKNLERSGDSFSWKVNLDSIVANIHRINESVDVFFDGPTLFLKGDNSTYITLADETELKNQFPNSTVVSFPDTGHWIHAEKPDMFYSVVRNWLVEK